MPKVAALQVIRLCSDEHSNASQIATAISGDQTLTTEVLRIANSSYFNYPREIANIQRAIVILGLNLIRDIAVSFAFRHYYKQFTGRLAIDFQTAWEHAVLTGAICRSLSGKFSLNIADTLFVGGLIHDIGKVALSVAIGQEYLELARFAAKNNTHLFLLEQEKWGFNHGDVGGILIERWQFPQILVNMITYHHYPADFSGSADVYRGIQVIYLSNLLAHCLRQESINLEDIIRLDANFTQLFPVSEREFEELVGGVKHALKNDRQLAAMGMTAYAG